MNHAACSPSGSTGWLNCPGWTSSPTSSVSAEYGTAAHTLAELVLSSAQTAGDFLGMDFDGIEVDDEMVRMVDTYADIVRELVDDDAPHWIERKVYLSPITGEEDAYGTADAVIIQGRELIVVDLKTGRNRVDADHNSQLSIYAAALLHEIGLLFDFDTVRLVVVQPSIHHVSEWVTTPADLDVFVEEVREAAALKLAGDSSRNPGEKTCRFCAHRGACKAQAEFALAAVADDFVTLDRPLGPQIAGCVERVENSDTSHLAECLGVVDLVESWCKAVREKATATIAAGGTVPGYKLIAGRRGLRKWGNPKLAGEILTGAGVDASVVFETAVASPATLEKILTKTRPEAWAEVCHLITQADGKPSLVPSSDPRPEIDSGSDYEV